MPARYPKVFDEVTVDVLCLNKVRELQNELLHGEKVILEVHGVWVSGTPDVPEDMCYTGCTQSDVRVDEEFMRNL